jgi:hypothetical protein
MAEKKKWVCFICSQDFIASEVWAEHITTVHQEWEEFIKCPECKIPCRDVKSHYHMHHKDSELPVLQQYRVNKLYDWDHKYRQEKKKHHKWKEGYFDSIKMGRKIHFRSSWERDSMTCFEKCPDIKEYYGDDHVCIPYKINGQPFNYWPDFSIRMVDNSVYIIEIKPENQTEWTINQAKWKYAVEYCKKRQYTFQVWTQNHIRKIKTRCLRNDVLLKEHVIPSEEETTKEIQIT